MYLVSSTLPYIIPGYELNSRDRKKPWSLFLWSLSFRRISAVKFDSQSSNNELPSVKAGDTSNMCLAQF